MAFEDAVAQVLQGGADCVRDHSSGIAQRYDPVLAEQLVHRGQLAQKFSNGDVVRLAHARYLTTEAPRHGDKQFLLRNSVSPWWILRIFVPVPLPERRLIERIRKASRPRPAAVPLGIGDDCAVLRPPAGHELLVTTDFSLEGVHFRRDWHTPEVVGHRCLTRGLSDIAAMGGEPLAVFLSLALPADLPQKWADGFLKGLLRLADKFDVPLAGGDTAQSPDGILADIIVTGSVPKRKAILRSGARPGDRIYVTGTLGGSAAAIDDMGRGRKLRERDYPQHFAPSPRIEVGRFLREKQLASAMIDVSDGLSVDLMHICEESSVGANLEPRAIPLAEIGRPAREVDLDFALHGGEDYELLFTAPQSKRVPSRVAGVPISMIGLVTPHPGIFIVGPNGHGVELLPRGWEHFRK